MSHSEFRIQLFTVLYLQVMEEQEDSVLSHHGHSSESDRFPNL